MKAEATWQGVPAHIKEDIVTSLDYKSRFRLRACSKNDRALIDSSSVFLHGIEVHIASGKNQETSNVLKIKDGGNSIEITNNIIVHFFHIFKLKRSFVENVAIVVHYSDTENTTLMEKMTETTKSCGGNFKIRAKRLYFKTTGLSDQHLFQVFQLFDSNLLESIAFGHKISDELLPRITKTESWKKAKEICFNKAQQLQVDHLLHVNKLRFFPLLITPEDMWKLIVTFTTRKKLSRHFGFRLIFRNEWNPSHFPAEFKASSIEKRR
ncbi:hypothetical protein GCK72_019530 [Caenorhabditis remanei]|uniref:F-box domain-containing protein n=1 Tax=Caenorhabditis remanei TaxID=31234 RepID=A0A6A5GE71_CAERE|nr:hypothetical protein GCK72_019530 [Caenorhabditis remanei]KAF1752975.1 hypothetical protein GCK72_019530 [Caenorhabditis remanei]